jgi:hypothetical protein
MFGDAQPPQAVDPAAQPVTPAGPRVVDPQDKALAADWLKRIEAALKRHDAQFKKFEENRKLLRGVRTDGTKIRANIHFANLATMRPQVYAKDPEYSVAPSPGVGTEQIEVTKKFGATAEAVLTHCLVKEARLKKRAKRLLTSAYTTSVGWWKLSWQEDKRTDPLIVNQIKDTQDNLDRLQLLREKLDDPQACSNTDLELAQLRETLAGLGVKAEITVARGLALDFVLSEDIVVLDQSVRELGDYERASAIAHRVWMTRDKYQGQFGYKAEKGKSYSEQGGQISGSTVGANTSADQKSDLLCVWEIWEQDSNRVFHVCDGEEGFCQPPMSPDWTGKRWYPFFGMAFNEIEGTFYPLSDVELTQPQVEDINEANDDFKRDRRGALPVNIVRKGGSLTPDDVERIKNRQGTDIIMVEGVGGQNISADIYMGQLAQLKPENYDSSQARFFMEQIIGGGDASRGSVLKAKTATEAEILSQGLRSRSSERQDTMEDLLTDVGVYALEICLRKLTPDEVRRIAGPDAVWPEMTADQVFEQVTLSVRGGSTGKPDRLQDQDRWTKLLPVIEKTVQQVSELRAQGQDQLAGALIELTRETLRRFDERLDIETFLPPASADGQPSPEQLAQENAKLKQQLQATQKELDDAKEETEKGYITAAASIATSPDPLTAATAFGQALMTLENREQTEQEPGQTGAVQAGPPGMPGMPPQMPMPALPQAPQSAPPMQ